ncbi:MAG: hypothetical protein R3D70_12100 [Rhizobiaceae bacterium]
MFGVLGSMFSSHRLATFAVAMSLVALPALGQESQQPSLEHQQEEISDHGEAAATNTTLEPVYADRFVTAIERIEAAIRELGEKDDGDAQAQREIDVADLRAQQRMAVWAYWMFVASVVSVVLTGVGVAFIWRTLLYTRDAAVHAGDAVLEAKNATKAAQDSVAVTRELGEAQVRCYLGVPSCSVARKVPGNSVLVTLRIRNSGQSPARFVNVTLNANLNFRVRENKTSYGFKDRGSVLTVVPNVQIVRSYVEFVGAGEEVQIERELFIVSIVIRRGCYCN